jgi:hypothetical protein
MKLLTRTRSFLATYWQPLALYAGLVLLFGGLLWLRLGTLPHGYAPGELAAQSAGGNLRDLLNHPLNAPYSLLVHGLMRLFGHDLFWLRAASTALGVLTLTIFYWLVHYWHGQRAAVLGTILFGCSAWFLHTARLGTPDVLQFLLLALVAASVWLKHSKKALPVLACFGLSAVLMYVPGMIWPVAALVLWQWRTIDRIFKRHLLIVSLGALVWLALLAPLGWAIYKNPMMAKELAGLPAQGWPQPLMVLRHLLDVPLNLFLRGPLSPEHWLARLAVLDAFCMAMLGLGGYLYFRYPRLHRTRLVAGVLILSIVLVALGGDVTLTVVIPFIYILVATGTGFLLDRWFVVFPRNVIAQSVGVGLVSIAVLASCWYNLRHYYVAWPNASATRVLFVIQQRAPSDTMKK